MSNNSAAVARKPRFSEAIATEGYRKLINRTLQDEGRANRFIATISSAVAVNTALQECDPGTILACALHGESLNLSPSPQLGQYYLVPFKDNKNNRTVATFILGYKGYVQLALRSGQYKKLNVMPIKKGELEYYDPLNEEIKVNLIQDELQRETAETIGYYAFFEYMNGFRKSLYWSKQKMENHAKRYSKAYNSSHSFWQRDFDSMGIKTMLRQLIGKWGIMSLEMQTAFTSDNSAMTMSASGEVTADFLTGHDINDMADAYIGVTDEVVDDVPSGAAEIINGEQNGEDAGTNVNGKPENGKTANSLGDI